MIGKDDCMKNNQKRDKLFVNQINTPNEVKKASREPKGYADSEPFCIMANQRHAVGSKIMNRDGTETVCTEKGWQKESHRESEKK